MLTQARLKELLHYNPRTGEFVWRVTVASKAQAGMRAGSTNSDGHRQIKVDKSFYYAHRLAWLYMTGVFPKTEIDHENRKRDDNRWRNLREATPGEQRRNARGRGGITGVKGVYLTTKGRYRACITHDGIFRHLGVFEDIEAATRERQAAEVILFGRFRAA